MSGEEKSGLDEVQVPSSLTGEQTQVPTVSDQWPEWVKGSLGWGRGGGGRGGGEGAGGRGEGAPAPCFQIWDQWGQIFGFFKKRQISGFFYVDSPEFSIFGSPVKPSVPAVLATAASSTPLFQKSQGDVSSVLQAEVKRAGQGLSLCPTDGETRMP